VVLLGRQLLAVDINELGPVKADSVGPVADDGGNLLDEFDISSDFDMMSVPGDGGQQGILERNLPRLFMMSLFDFIPPDDFRLGIDNHQTGGAVDDDQIVGPDPAGNVLQSDDGRDLDGAGHDRRVGGFSPDVRREPLDLFDFHLGRVRRRQIRGNDDDPLSDRRPHLALLSAQISQNHLADIADIAEAPLEVFVFHSVEDLAITVEGHAERPLRVDADLFDVLNGPVDEFPVLENHEMDIDDVLRLRHLQVYQFFLDAEKLLFRVLQGGPETFDFRGDQAAIVQFVDGDLGVQPVEKIGLPDHNAGRDADPLQNEGFFHGVSHSRGPFFDSKYFNPHRTCLR